MKSPLLKKGHQAIFTIEGATSGGSRGYENPPSEYITANMDDKGVVEIFRFKKDGSFRKIETDDNGRQYLEIISQRKNDYNLVVNDKPEDVLTNDEVSKKLIDSIADFKSREIELEKRAFESSKQTVEQHLFIETIDEYNPDARRADPILFTITPTGDPQNPTFETKLQRVKEDGSVVDVDGNHQSIVNRLRNRYTLGYDGKEMISFKGVDNFISPEDALKISNGELNPNNEKPELKKTEQIIFDKSEVSDVAVIEKNDNKSTATLYKNDGETQELDGKESSRLIKLLSDAGKKPLAIIDDAKNFISGVDIKKMVSNIGTFAKSLKGFMGKPEQEKVDVPENSENSKVKPEQEKVTSPENNENPMVKPDKDNNQVDMDIDELVKSRLTDRIDRLFPDISDPQKLVLLNKFTQESEKRLSESESRLLTKTLEDGVLKIESGENKYSLTDIAPEITSLQDAMKYAAFENVRDSSIQKFKNSPSFLQKLEDEENGQQIIFNGVNADNQPEIYSFSIIGADTIASVYDSSGNFMEKLDDFESEELLKSLERSGLEANIINNGAINFISNKDIKNIALDKSSNLSMNMSKSVEGQSVGVDVIDYGSATKEKAEFKVSDNPDIDYGVSVKQKPEFESSLSKFIPGIDDPVIDYKSVSIPEGKPKPDGIPQPKVESKQNRLNKI